mgnify:CR=1 FL=1
MNNGRHIRLRGLAPWRLGERSLFLILCVLGGLCGELIVWNQLLKSPLAVEAFVPRGLDLVDEMLRQMAVATAVEEIDDEAEH